MEVFPFHLALGWRVTAKKKRITVFTHSFELSPGNSNSASSKLRGGPT